MRLRSAPTSVTKFGINELVRKISGEFALIIVDVDEVGHCDSARDTRSGRRAAALLGERRVRPRTLLRVEGTRGRRAPPASVSARQHHVGAFHDHRSDDTCRAGDQLG